MKKQPIQIPENMREVSPRELRTMNYVTNLSFDTAIGIPRPGYCTESKRREFLIRYLLRRTFPDLLIIKGDRSYDGVYSGSQHRVEIKTGLKSSWVIHRQNLDDLKDWILAKFNRETGWPTCIYRVTGYGLGKFYTLVSECIWNEDHRMRAVPRRKEGYVSISEKWLLENFTQQELECYDGEGNRVY